MGASNVIIGAYRIDGCVYPRVVDLRSLLSEGLRGLWIWKVLCYLLVVQLDLKLWWNCEPVDRKACGKARGGGGGGIIC